MLNKINKLKEINEKLRLINGKLETQLFIENIDLNNTHIHEHNNVETQTSLTTIKNTIYK